MENFSDFIFALVVFLSGMLASFFFSGTEIGFYRVSRAKLIVDSLLGCRRSRILLWLTNHPPIFISTVLLGNNLANNFVSLGAVMLFQVLFPTSSAALLSTVVATPVVFIYGELLPKSIFLEAPTRLMKRCAPLFAILVPLFLPLSLFLSFLNVLMSRLLGERSPRWGLQMTDTELQHLLGEGKNAGILRKTQQSMAEELFQRHSSSLERFTVPLKNFPFVNEKMTREKMIQTARRAGTPWILAQKEASAAKKFQPDGFYDFNDLLLTPSNQPLAFRPLLELPVSTSFADAMAQMLVSDVPFAILKNVRGESVGLIQRTLS